jgi:hypothetical protein
MKKLVLDKIKPSRNCPYLPSAADMRRIRKELGNEKAAAFFLEFTNKALGAENGNSSMVCIYCKRVIGAVLGANLTADDGTHLEPSTDDSGRLVYHVICDGCKAKRAGGPEDGEQAI